MLEISHSHEEGTLLAGTARGDGSGEVVKACGWRWSRNLGCWYVQRSRDRDADMALIGRTVERLREAGFGVGVEVDNARRSRAEIEECQGRRSRERAQALAAKAERRGEQARRAHEVADRASAAVPPGGEPIKVGHHSEAGHRRSIERAQTTLSAAVAADHAVREAQRRAATASAATGHRFAPAVVGGRIDRLEAEVRKLRRLLDAGGTDQYRERIRGLLAQAVDDLTYWREVREQQLQDGSAPQFGPGDVEVGGAIVINGETAYRVVRVNQKTVTATSGPTTSRIRYHQIKRVLSKEEFERAAQRVT